MKIKLLKLFLVQVGVRKAMLSGGALFGSGLAIAGAGAHIHNAGLYNIFLILILQDNSR